MRVPFLQQGHREIHGGQGCAKLVGDVRHRVGQADFVRCETVGLFFQPDRHLLQFALQNGQFSLPALRNQDCLLPVQDAVQPLCQTLHLAVTPPCEEPVRGAEQDTGQQEQSPARGMERKTRKRQQNRHDSIGQKFPPELRISDFSHVNPSCIQGRARF